MIKIKKILSKQLGISKPEREISEKINEISQNFIKQLNSKLRKKKISAEVFIGGSLAKGTLVKKSKYDVDIFVRFSDKYDEAGISKLLGKILGKKAKKIHGSRDYYQQTVDEIIMEIIPVFKIKKPEDAKNVMDLSYFHVNYVLKKAKQKKKISDEIILIKSFCYAQNCYGAEGYIKGFSGYALELLIAHYGSFEKFLQQVVKTNNNEKIIIDNLNYYKNKNILQELNESKLNSPIILIDPTYKQRNALAGLSDETFYKFKEVCKKFLKNPSSEFFIPKEIGIELNKKYKDKLKVIKIRTKSQQGDIAGTKSKKFFDFFKYRVKKEFKIKLAEFDYNETRNIAAGYFVLDKKQDELVRGPFIFDKKNVARFKKIHKKTITKKGSLYVKVKHNLSFESWFKLFLNKEKKIIKQMNVKRIELDY
jgi:tRNA nucleotidyltransferase (CCA-adding enzyme)